LSLAHYFILLLYVPYLFFYTVYASRATEAVLVTIVSLNCFNKFDLIGFDLILHTITQVSFLYIVLFGVLMFRHFHVPFTAYFTFAAFGVSINSSSIAHFFETCQIIFFSRLGHGI